MMKSEVKQDASLTGNCTVADYYQVSCRVAGILNQSTSAPDGRSISCFHNESSLLPRNENLAKVEIAVLATIFVVAMASNLGVLLAMYRMRKKMTRMHIFIMHLGFTDLVVALFQVLPQMIWEVTYRFVGPDFLCRVVRYMQLLCMFASTYMLIMMTVDRYIAVCHPLKTIQQPSKQANLMIAVTWLVSGALSIPQMFIFSLKEVKEGSCVFDCWATFEFDWGIQAYITWTTLSIFVIPVAILIVCYSLICYEIYKNFRCKTQTRKSKNGLQNSQLAASRVSSVRSISRAKIRTVKMAFVIVLTYIACWTPFFSVHMWSVWDVNAPKEDSDDTAFTITMLLGSLSSCCNPWIYMAFSGHFIQDIFRYIPCCRRFQYKLRRQGSNGSLSCRRNTLLTKLNH
ncbi:vasopressin V1b receptor [Protopterus annectens]|uniref:Vasotocin type1b receptor n=1 Tax=Protopterus annectens TaxID=7888 RepID=H7CEB4_PROAN|nr:vasopressin V1b receptor [Protopterus annectens]BAL70281.1 vasotocin type1b receptor [Protopterus annectens]